MNIFALIQYASILFTQQSTYYISGTVISTLQILTRLLLVTLQLTDINDIPHFIEEDTEA